MGSSPPQTGVDINVMASVQGIASYATNLAAAQLRDDVGTAVAKKALNAAEAQGAAAVSMLEAAAQLQEQMVASPGRPPHLGNHVDVLA